MDESDAVQAAGQIDSTILSLSNESTLAHLLADWRHTSLAVLAKT